jgi:hypothetical protein
VGAINAPGKNLPSGESSTTTAAFSDICRAGSLILPSNLDCPVSGEPTLGDGPSRSYLRERLKAQAERGRREYSPESGRKFFAIRAVSPESSSPEPRGSFRPFSWATLGKGRRKNFAGDRDREYEFS